MTDDVNVSNCGAGESPNIINLPTINPRHQVGFKSAGLNNNNNNNNNNNKL